jgi:MSHA biogenesis protein MshM
VIAHMTRACDGLTRRLNLVADKALLAAFAQGTHNVSLDHVKAAIRDSEFSHVELPRNHPPMPYALAGLLVGGVLGIAAFAAYQAFDSPRTAVAPSPAATTQSPAATVQIAPNPPETVAVTNAPVTNVMPASAQSDVLDQRLLVTDEWLAQQNGASYSIQLLGSNDPELLREYFKTIAKYLEIEKVYVYRTTANRRPSLTVLYGTFATREEVMRALRSLPDELKLNRPYYRTLQGIRSEIAHQRS